MWWGLARKKGTVRKSQGDPNERMIAWSLILSVGGIVSSHLEQRQYTGRVCDNKMTVVITGCTVMNNGSENISYLIVSYPRMMIFMMIFSELE